MIKFILQIFQSTLKNEKHVSKEYTFSACESVEAVNKIANNDDNKVYTVDNNIQLGYLIIILIEINTGGSVSSTLGPNVGS